MFVFSFSFSNKRQKEGGEKTEREKKIASQYVREDDVSLAGPMKANELCKLASFVLLPLC